MRYILIPLILLLASFPVHAAVFFSEVFPNPIADESLNEWIEIVNNNSFEIDMKGWVFGDGKDNDTLEGGLYEGSGTVIPPFETALITDDATRVYNNFNIPSSVVRLYVNDSSLGNGLGNMGETIYLFNGETFIDTATYPKVKEGMSASFTQEGWIETIPTPGLFNHSLSESTLPCDYKIILEMEGSSFLPNDFAWRMRASNVKGGKTNITGRALIVNALGEEVKSYKTWTNQSITTQKTSPKYSPNLKGGSYIIFANLTTSCEDTNANNNQAFHFFTIKETKEEVQENSELSILNILDLGKDKEAKFGQVIRVRLYTYRGDTGRSSISFWVEHKGKRITKQSKLSVEEKFASATYTVPIFLPPNCDDEFDDGTYDVVVEGLSEEDNQRIKIKGVTPSLCPKAKTSTPRKKIGFELVAIDNYNNGVSGSATLRIWNDEKATKKAEIWSYIYRGSKSYSGERESNKKSITIQPNSVSEIIMKNAPFITEEGSYKIKFLLHQEGRKTPDELVKDIFIEKAHQQDQTLTLATQPSQEKKEETLAIARPLTMPKIVYESSSMKAKKTVILLLLFLIILLAVLMVWYAD